MKLRDLFEAPQRTASIAFGRMNPPTIGHSKLVDAIKAQNGDPFVFLSQSQKPKTDPLSFADKLRYAKFFFPQITIGNPEVRTVIQALQKIESMGYQNLIYVAGSDRVAQFEKLLNDYNGKDYNFKSISIVSAGERDPDADGAEGMSASKMRQAAVDNDLESFKQGVPQQEVADEMFAAVRQGMGINDTVPAESIEESEWSLGDERALKSVQKTLPKLKNAAAAGRLDKVFQYFDNTIEQVMHKADLGTKVLDMFTMWATQIKKGIDTGVYTAEQLPQMQKAYDSIMSKMPGLRQKNAENKKTMAKRYGKVDSKVDDKGNYKGTNITPTAQQSARMESATKPNMNKVLTALKKKLKDEGGAAGFDPLKAVAKKMDVNLTPAMLKGMSGIKMHRDGDYILEEVKPGQTLPKQIDVIKMPTPPQVPTGPDGKDGNGTRIGTTAKGNRSVTNGGGTFIFTPKGKLMLYMTPKIGGLQQTHNIAKQTVTVNFDTIVDQSNINQKATYDMGGKLISGDTTSIKSGPMGITTDKDKGQTVDYTSLTGNKHSINSKDPKRMDKMSAMKKDMAQGRAAMKKGQDAALNKIGIK